MASDVLGGPYLAAGVLAVAVFPHVVDGQRVRRFARKHVLAEEAPDHVVVDGQAVLREYRIAELLEFLEDFVVDARVVVIRTAKKHYAQAVFALKLIEHFAGGAAHGDVVKIIERPIASVYGTLVLARSQAHDVLEL